MPWYIPLFIFCARVVDVSMGTLRILFVVRGQRLVASMIGFFEVVIWILAVSGAIKYLSHPMAVIAYGGGFAVGTAVGIGLERALAIGFQAVRAINTDRNVSLAWKLRDEGYAVTQIQGEGLMGPVEICFIAVSRDEVPKLEKKIFEVAPGSFVTVEDLRQTKGGVVRRPASQSPPWLRLTKFR